MQVSRLIIQNFRGIKNATLDFSGHTLILGGNNVGKSTICEALDLTLGVDRTKKFPVVEEYDFYNGQYLDDNENPIEIRIESILIELTETIQNLCTFKLERWHITDKRILGVGEIENVDDENTCWCLRILTIAKYDKDEDEFVAKTYYANSYDCTKVNENTVSRSIKQKFGFIYLRTVRTGARALSLERGSLLDIILRIKSFNVGIWEDIRNRLKNLEPPIEESTQNLNSVLHTIETRLSEYIFIANPGNATRLNISKLTREHLRKTLSFFIAISEDQIPIPFSEVGTGTLNVLVLALLSFLADLKEENIIFAMEEPEIALAPYTQRRIAKYLLNGTTQCFVTSHSPYIIESFAPEFIRILNRTNDAEVFGNMLPIGQLVKKKTYNRFIRRGLAESLLAKAVILVEGISEQFVMQTVSHVLEENSTYFYPLCLSGVSILSTDGSGSMAELGRLFSGLKINCYAFYDKKKLSEKEEQALAIAGFKEMHEIKYTGIEQLLVEEISIEIQKKYISLQNDNEIDIFLEDKECDNAKIKKLTLKILKDGKGWGRSADLLELCHKDELPESIFNFLKCVYDDFPFPNGNTEVIIENF